MCNEYLLRYWLKREILLNLFLSNAPELKLSKEFITKTSIGYLENDNFWQTVAVII